MLDISRLSIQRLRHLEDPYVDELFECGVDVGAPMLKALLSRAFLDLNREPFELDPQMYLEALPGHMNTTSPRVLAGLGTVPRGVSEYEEIYRGRLPHAEALGRIETCYRPYHRAMTDLVNELHNATGFALLIDCHSMPSSAVSHLTGPKDKSIDIVIGDRFGAACNREIAVLVEELLQAEGLNVSRNRPYAGGFITETHGNPRQNRHALQIEVNRSLYLNEQNFEITANFKQLQESLKHMFIGLASFLPNKRDIFVPKAA